MKDLSSLQKCWGRRSGCISSSIDSPKLHARPLAVVANPVAVTCDVILVLLQSRRDPERDPVEHESEGLEEEYERDEEEVVFLRMVHEAVGVVLADKLVFRLPEGARLAQDRVEVAYRR